MQDFGVNAGGGGNILGEVPTSPHLPSKSAQGVTSARKEKREAIVKRKESPYHFGSDICKTFLNWF
jgi:hypothetical protein